MTPPHPLHPAARVFPPPEVRRRSLLRPALTPTFISSPHLSPPCLPHPPAPPPAGCEDTTGQERINYGHRGPGYLPCFHLHRQLISHHRRELSHVRRRILLGVSFMGLNETYVFLEYFICRTHTHTAPAACNLEVRGSFFLPPLPPPQRRRRSLSVTATLSL